MIHFTSISFLKKNIFPFNKLPYFFLLFNLFLFIAVLFFFSCSSTRRFPGNEETRVIATELRVLLNEYKPAGFLTIESPVYLYNQGEKLALIRTGNTVECYENYGKIRLTINGENFDGEKFFINPTGNDEIIKINGKSYRGKIQVSFSNNSVDLINIVDIEDYIKGVLAKEMPVGKNDENYEALKALAVCIRTYAIKKMQDGKIYFDLYSDTRDQVYGGVDGEHPLSNKAVDETRNIILKFEGQPALLYYHSTCGGFTESSQNVFTKDAVPYLISVKDGNEPYCKISPRFQWEEVYSRDDLINRLKSASILDNLSYQLEDISIINKFESGRVSELEIKVVDVNGEEKSVLLKGNEIRSIIRTADNKNILWSTLFDLSINSNSVVLAGKGFGHGVGLCQWGAIALSRNGWNYKNILEHYYPGTNAGNFDD